MGTQCLATVFYIKGDQFRFLIIISSVFNFQTNQWLGPNVDPVHQIKVHHYHYQPSQPFISTYFGANILLLIHILPRFSVLHIIVGYILT